MARCEVGQGLLGADIAGDSELDPHEESYRPFLPDEALWHKNNLNQKHHFQLLAKPPNYADWNYAQGHQLNRQFGTAAFTFRHVA